MKIVLQWLAANLVLAGVGLCGLIGALAVILPARFLLERFRIAPEWWVLVQFLAIAATLAGVLLGGRLILRIVEKVGNGGH